MQWSKNAKWFRESTYLRSSIYGPWGGFEGEGGSAGVWREQESASEEIERRVRVAVSSKKVITREELVQGVEPVHRALSGSAFVAPPVAKILLC